MEEKKEELVEDVSSDRMFSVDARKESSELNTGSHCQIDVHTVQNPVINVKNSPPVEGVSLEKSQSCNKSTSPDKKTHGTLTVLYTSPNKHPVSVTSTHVLTTESGDCISAKSFSKRELLSQNAHQTDIFAVSVKPGKCEQIHGGGSSGESSVQDSSADSNISRRNIKPMESTRLTYISKSCAHPSVTVSKTWNSSHTMEAVCESSKNRNNNNNIDKPSDTCVNTADPSVDLKEGHTLTGSEKLWCQVPYNESKKSSARLLPCVDTGAAHSHEGTRRSMSMQTDILKSGGLLPQRSDHDAGHVDTSSGVKSINQSQLAVSLTVNEPELPFALHHVGSNVTINKTIASSTSDQSRGSEASTSQIEPLKLIKSHSAASLLLGNNFDVNSMEDFSGMLKMVASLNQLSGNVSRNEAVVLSSSSETGNTMSMNSNKSFVPSLMLRYPEAASDHLVHSVMTPVETKISTAQPDSSACTKDKLQSMTPKNISLSELERPSFSANHPSGLNSLRAAQSAPSNTAAQSATINQQLLTQGQPLFNRDYKVPLSVPSSKIRDTATKTIRKSRSKSTKPKSQKPSLLSTDDDDDDNDFIPVGMLQLSSVKSPDGSDTVSANTEMFSAESSEGTPYQLNLGLNVMYQQQSHTGSDLILSAGKQSHESGNEFVQEKLKQKLQQRKLQSPTGMGHLSATHHHQRTQHHQNTQHTQLPQKVIQFQMPAKSIKVQQQEVQQYDSHQQHQFLLQLVQHAQQQQKQLQDHQQLLQQPQSSLNLPSSNLAKTASFSKNQGLIIHHHQPQDVKVVTSVESLSLQTLMKDHPVNSEHVEVRHLKQEKKLEENIQQPFNLDKTQKKNGEIEEGHQEQQKDQRYPLQYSQVCQPVVSSQIQSETVIHPETSWQSPNTSKIAERLFQQSVSHQMLQQSLSEPMLLRCKTEQLTPSPQQVSISRADLTTTRSVTPIPASLPNTGPSVNQQHPEIARMLNSPVSPRQPGSPRRSVSPRRVVSPIQSSSTSSQFFTPRQTVTLPSRQTSSLRQSLNSKPIVSVSSSSSYQSSSLKQQTDSSEQLSNSWSPTHSLISPESQDCSQPFTGQIISVNLLIDQGQMEQSKVNLNQAVPVSFETPQFAANEQQYGNNIKQISFERQHGTPDLSTSLTNSSAQLICSQSFPLSHSVQSFSPGQVIHHRPSERRSLQNKVPTMHKPQSPASIQFPSQTVPSTKVPMPSIQNTTVGWHSVPNQVRSQRDDVQHPSSQPADMKILARNNQQIQKQQVCGSSGQNQLPEVNLMGIQHNVTDQRHIRSNSPEALSNKGVEKHIVEMQPCSTTTNFTQPVSTHAEQRSLNSLVMSSSYGRPFQNIASLTEKENSLLQFLFPNSPSVQSIERIQANLKQTSHAVSQMQTSMEMPQKCEDSLRIYTNIASMYPEMRKNDGGLKVLSEIASERYALAVAGKDDMNDQQAGQPGYQSIVQRTLDRSEANDQISQRSECEALSGQTKLSLGIAECNASQNQIENSKAKTDLFIENKHNDSNTESRLIEKEESDSFVAHNETPRREVRQRKPKKPFEQDEMPVKRSSKNSPQKNIGNKKQVIPTPTQKRSHKKGQGKKAALAKLKEAAEQEEIKHKSTRQTRLTAEDKDIENKHTDVIEDIEDFEHSESDSSLRRLSRRLQVKEKERLEQKNTDSINTRRVSRQSARVNYKEDAVDSVDESTPARNARSSRRTSISSADEVEVTETPDRMTTRSKNRNADDKTTVKSGARNDSHNHQPDNSVEKIKSTNTASRITPKAIIQGSNKESRRDTRNTSKSPGQVSRSRSPIRIEATASSSQRRIVTRQAVADLDNSGSGVGTKMKRPLSPELVEKLPQEQKRVKKPVTPKNPQESNKSSAEKTGSLKDNAPKENLTNKQVEISKDITKLKTEAAPIKHKRTKKQKNKKKSRLNHHNTIPKEDLKHLKPELGEDTNPAVITSRRKEEAKSQENNPAISTSESKEKAKSQENKMVSCLENGETDVEPMLTESEVIKTNVKGKKPLRYTPEETSQKATRSMKNNDVTEEDAAKEKNSEVDRQVDVELQEVDKQLGAEVQEVDRQVDAELQVLVTEAELVPEPKSVEQQSVIRSTSTFLSSTAQVKGSSAQAALVPDEAASLSNDKSFSHSTLASERQKMVMYKLVPILEDDVTDLEETMVPVSGFFVPGGNSDRILLPHNFLHGSATTKMSSSTPSSSMASWQSPVLAPQMSTPPTSVVPPSTEASDNTLTSVASNTSSLASELLSSVGVTAVLSPLRTALCTTVVSTLSSAVPSVAQSSTWTPQLPHSSQALSVSQPLSLMVPKKSWTSTAPQASPPQYRPSPSWNAAQSSKPSSQLPTSSSAWSSSSSSIPLPPVSQQQQQLWTATSQQVSQESWSSPPSVTAAAIESWSKEFFPTTVFSNSVNLRERESMIQSPAQRNNSTTQNVLHNAGYNMEAGSPHQQPPMYSSNHDHTASSGNLYSAGTSQDSEFTDNKQDTVIQGFLRHVSSNPGGFSQELAGFNLGQHDLAYLENRLRQTLSPNTLFSAVAAAYDDASGHGTVVSHDNSLQESINLVHTVNLDMDEDNLDSSANLDLSDLGSTSASGLNMSKSLDGQESSRGHQDVLQPQADSNAVGARDLDNSVQEAEVGTREPKSDSKKPVRERKSQYEIVTENDVKKYRCLLCCKNFGVSTIYRHLKIHDPDYKVKCSDCGKEYTQRSSLITHWEKTHGDGSTSSGAVRRRKRVSSSERETLCPAKSPNISLDSSGAHLSSLDISLKSSDGEMMLSESPVKSLKTQLKSPEMPIINSTSEFKCERTVCSMSEITTTGHDKPEQLSKQQAAHQQVEELRRFKAEKKFAAAQRKAESHALDDSVTNDDDLHRSTSKFESCSDETAAYNIASSKSFIHDRNEQSSGSFEQGIIQKTSYPDSASSAGPQASLNSSHPQENYDSDVVLKPEGVTQFQFNSPHPVMSRVPQFHADNIPKPISTPIIKSNIIRDADSQKEMAPSAEGSHLNACDKHICEICNTQLNTKNGYLLHIRRHNKDKTKFCSYCNKGFHTSQELRSHERTHTGEKPYKCEICHTSFAHSGSFVSHKKSHEKRGEKETFPIIDGKIQYPPTFKKPRLSGGTNGNGEKPRRIKKTKPKMVTSLSADSDQVNQNLGSQQTSVIRRNNPDNNLTDSTQGDFVKNIPGRWESMNEQQLTPDRFRSNTGNPTLSDHNLSSDDFKIMATQQNVMSQDQGSREYSLSDDNYSSSAGNVTLEYYNNSSGYSQGVQRQQEFLSPHLSTSSSPHDYYKQDKFYQRSSSVEAFSTGSRNQAVAVPVNLAIEKGQQYCGTQSYSDSGQGSASYSPHQHSSEYHYNVVPQSGEANYQQEDYEDSLAQYKNDPSSSEIVKKLLQHYNVPSSPFQEAVPLDYSHQMQDTSEYSRIGHNAVSDYSSLGVGSSAQAPPPYSVSITAQQKHFYSSQSSTSDYDSSLSQQQQQTLMTQDQQLPSPHDQQRQLLQPYLVKEEQFESPQSHAQDMYGSEDRYISYQDSQFTNQALTRPPSQSYSQSYEVRTSLAHEYYSHSLPKIETLTRDPVGSPSTETK